MHSPSGCTPTCRAVLVRAARAKTWDAIDVAIRVRDKVLLILSKDAIDVAIRVRDKVLLILSKNAIASDWVEDEVSKAFAEEKRRGQVVLFPVTRRLWRPPSRGR